MVFPSGNKTLTKIVWVGSGIDWETNEPHDFSSVF